MEDRSNVAALLFGIALVAVGAFSFGFSAGCQWVQWDAVQNNAAYWHPQTAEFTWGKPPGDNHAEGVQVPDSGR